MPRIARILPEKGVLLILARGNNHQWVFIVTKILNMKIEPFPFLRTHRVKHPHD